MPAGHLRRTQPRRVQYCCRSSLLARYTDVLKSRSLGHVKEHQATVPPKIDKCTEHATTRDGRHRRKLDLAEGCLRMHRRGRRSKSAARVVSPGPTAHAVVPKTIMISASLFSDMLAITTAAADQPAQARHIFRARIHLTPFQ